jgi:NTE family protein
VIFDIYGGTSVGAGMLAGFAALISPEEIDLGTHQVVVESRGFKQFTIPRYALVDHVDYDEALRKQYRGVSIEDLWRPYFAVATILDGLGQGPYLMRRGLLWKAVRASSSIPAVLPRSSPMRGTCSSTAAWSRTFRSSR